LRWRSNANTDTDSNGDTDDPDSNTGNADSNSGDADSNPGEPNANATGNTDAKCDTVSTDA
jgi:hypothetical protein